MTADHDSVCNYRKCRKSLKSNAWVTSCSHIFCDEHGVREFQKSNSCPACETSLAGRYDIIRIDVQPSEQYKSMVLAGQKPETIMDICSRALSFWTYQAHQEKAYQEYVASKAKERNTQQEQYYEQMMTTLQSELSASKSQLAATRKEIESLKQQYSESQERMMEKSRQYQKLQLMYDSVRRKYIKFDNTDMVPQLTPTVNRGDRVFEMDPFINGDRMYDSQDLLLRSSQSNGSGDHRPMPKPFTSPARGFVFCPNHTPTIGSISTGTTGPGPQHRKS